MEATFTMRRCTLPNRHAVSRKGAATFTAHVISRPSCMEKGREGRRGAMARSTVGRCFKAGGWPALSQRGAARGQPGAARPGPVRPGQQAHPWAHLAPPQLRLVHPGIVDQHIDAPREVGADVCCQLSHSRQRGKVTHVAAGGAAGSAAGGRHLLHRLLHPRLAPAAKQAATLESS